MISKLLKSLKKNQLVEAEHTLQLIETTHLVFRCPEFADLACKTQGTNTRYDGTTQLLGFQLNLRFCLVAFFHLHDSFLRITRNLIQFDNCIRHLR